MDKLPQELVDRVVGFSDPEDFKNLLTVSKAFRYTIEHVSGVFTDFLLKKSNAKRFLQLYSRRRFAYLRHVRFRPILPPLEHIFDEDEEPCRETTESLSKKDETFTEQVRFLFDTLKTLEERIKYSNRKAKLKLSVFAPKRRVGRGCLHRVCVCWRIHLLRPEMLPNLHSVRCFQLLNEDEVCRDSFNALVFSWSGTTDEEQQATAKMDLRILIDIATKLPSLEYLGCKLQSYFWGMTLDDEVTHHYVQDWPGPHRDTRHDFAKTVATAPLPTSLKGLSIILSYGESDDTDRNQLERLPNLVHPFSHDPFSDSLRLLSYRLRHMVLKGMVDYTVFWPTDNTVPAWPNLKTLNICFKPGSPSGSWYFQGPKGEGSDLSPGYNLTDAHYEPLTESATDKHNERDFMFHRTLREVTFRVMPLERMLVPFLTAFANAAIQMPALEEAVLWSCVSFTAEDAFREYPNTGAHRYKYYGHSNPMLEDVLGWGIMYAAPGHHLNPFPDAPTDADEKYSDRQIWWAMMDWRPDDSLLDLFRRIGRSEHGDSLKEYWLDKFGSCELLAKQAIVGLDDLDTNML